MYEPPISYLQLTGIYSHNLGQWLTSRGLGRVELSILKQAGILNPRYTAVYHRGNSLLCTTHQYPHSDGAMYYERHLPTFEHVLRWMYVKDDGNALYNSWGVEKRYLVHSVGHAEGQFWYTWRLDHESLIPSAGVCQKGYTLVSQSMTDETFRTLKPYVADDAFNTAMRLYKVYQTLPFLLPYKIA